MIDLRTARLSSQAPDCGPGAVRLALLQFVNLSSHAGTFQIDTPSGPVLAFFDADEALRAAWDSGLWVSGVTRYSGVLWPCDPRMPGTEYAHEMWEAFNAP